MPARRGRDAPRDSMTITDFHNHLMPGVDDGAKSVEHARTALAALRDAGVARIITTPHFNASVTLDAAALARRLAELDAGWEQLRPLAAEFGVELHRGAEVALDVPRPDLGDPRIHLAGTRFVLVEFAFMTVPPHSASVLSAVRAGGVQPVLAHPERYGRLESDPVGARAWREAGALLQVNGGSLLGRYGEGARRTALRLLREGLVDYVCSDFHARGDPGIGRYREALEELGGHEQARLLLEVNPQRLLEDEPPLPVPPLAGARGTLRDRLRRLFT